MIVTRAFPRTGGAPHVPTLCDALRGLIPGAFHLRAGAGTVVIDTTTWDGVDITAVQAQVAAAPADTETVRAKYDASSLPPLLRALAWALLDLVNVERARHGATAVTPAQFVALVKDKV